MSAAERDPFARFLKHFPKGTVLFNEGDEGEDMYIIRTGRVAIKKRVADGDITVAVLEKGDFFGEMAVLERIPRTAGAEMAEDGDLIVIGSDVFGDMVKNNPEIAVRMLRKYSVRLRETTKQLETLKRVEAFAAPPAAGMTIERIPEPARVGSTATPAGRPVEPVPAARVVTAPQAAPIPVKAGAQPGASPLAFFVSNASGNVFPVLKPDSLIGRYDSVTGMAPDVDLTHEDASRNISRRHARLLIKDGRPYVAEEIGTMNGTYLNGHKLPTGVLTVINDGDQLTLCRLTLTFRLPERTP
ncbi:MAG TPA: cyclic nucleotide-binding domain-containing protein [Vicinamibacteria bacterium]|nr:cyclic nucleotide-binding domain-containing protein [Vicinamibacteria bacterium]